MKIPNPSPVIIPPTQEESYPDLWIRQIFAYAPNLEGHTQLRIDVLPYNYEEKKLLGDEFMETLSLDLWEALQNIPEVQNIFFQIIQSLPVIRDYVNKTGRYAPVVENN
jgi:hypothetical protein